MTAPKTTADTETTEQVTSRATSGVTSRANSSRSSSGKNAAKKSPASEKNVSNEKNAANVKSATTKTTGSRKKAEKKSPANGKLVSKEKNEKNTDKPASAQSSARKVASIKSGAMGNSDEMGELVNSGESGKFSESGKTGGTGESVKFSGTGESVKLSNPELVQPDKSVMDSEQALVSALKTKEADPVVEGKEAVSAPKSTKTRSLPKSRNVVSALKTKEADPAVESKEAVSAPKSTKTRSLPKSKNAVSVLKTKEVDPAVESKEAVSVLKTKDVDTAVEGVPLSKNKKIKKAVTPAVSTREEAEDFPRSTMRDSACLDSVCPDSACADSACADFLGQTVLPDTGFTEPVSPEAIRAEALEHGARVADLADMLFQDLKKLHKLSEDWGRYLQQAALVHDIGYIIGHRGHHKTGMLQVETDDSLPVADSDRGIVALLVRYHRKAWPSKKHSEFAELNKEDRAALSKTAAILRIADALDYTHQGLVRSVSAHEKKSKVILELQCVGDASSELERVLVKGDLFEHIFEKKLVCTTLTD